MSGPLPWTPTAQVPPQPNMPDTLLRIERNTAEMVRWVKILVVVVAVMILLDALLFV
ncbi:MAG TPA: hypothetical protein VEG66_03130 [Thermoplasmata archaeon]|nr:hypothetical protein [Thermoplasmata archaeon]